MKAAPEAAPAIPRQMLISACQIAIISTLRVASYNWVHQTAAARIPKPNITNCKGPKSGRIRNDGRCHNHHTGNNEVFGDGHDDEEDEQGRQQPREILLVQFHLRANISQLPVDQARLASGNITP